MTSPDVPARKDRWLLAVGYGLLAEIATIATIVLAVTVLKYVVLRGSSAAGETPLSGVAGLLVGVWGGALYTFIFARRLMSRISSHFVAHGIVVALAATALATLGSIAGHQGVPRGYLVATALKVIAGALAGFIYQRYMAADPSTR